MWQIYSKKSKKCEICCALIIHSGDNINAVPLIRISKWQGWHWHWSVVYVIVFRFSTELCAVLRLSGPLKSQYAKVCIIYVYKSFVITIIQLLLICYIIYLHVIMYLFTFRRNIFLYTYCNQKHDDYKFSFTAFRCFYLLHIFRTSRTHTQIYLAEEKKFLLWNWF